jgi:hypothetical protein
MGLREIFEKQGGMKLIHQYRKAGALGTAIGEFLLLGKSRTALEILRNSAQLKIVQRLERIYGSKADRLLSEFDDHVEHRKGENVWFCWFQGIENAPEIVQQCYCSASNAFYGKKKIQLLTETNYREFIQFPEIIEDKIQRGIIKGAHLSDLIRLELLIKYGGIWSDATVYYSGEVPEYMLNPELFLFQCLKPGSDGQATKISNWFISARSNNKLLTVTRDILYDYWSNNDELVDYFLFHDMFQIVIDRCNDEWKNVIPFSNSTPHILLLRLFEKYDPEIWEALKSQTSIHKLTYKFSDADTNKEGTYYEKIIKHDSF